MRKEGQRNEPSWTVLFVDGLFVSACDGLQAIVCSLLPAIVTVAGTGAKTEGRWGGGVADTPLHSTLPKRQDLALIAAGWHSSTFTHTHLHADLQPLFPERQELRPASCDSPLSCGHFLVFGCRYRHLASRTVAPSASILQISSKLCGTEYTVIRYSASCHHNACVQNNPLAFTTKKLHHPCMHIVDKRRVMFYAAVVNKPALSLYNWHIDLYSSSLLWLRSSNRTYSFRIRLFFLWRTCMQNSDWFQFKCHILKIVFAFIVLFSMSKIITGNIMNNRVKTHLKRIYYIDFWCYKESDNSSEEIYIIIYVSRTIESLI